MLILSSHLCLVLPSWKSSATNKQVLDSYSGVISASIVTRLRKVRPRNVVRFPAWHETSFTLKRRSRPRGTHSPLRTFLGVKQPACEAPSSLEVQIYILESWSYSLARAAWIHAAECPGGRLQCMQTACDSVRLTSGRRQLFRYSAKSTAITTLPIFMADIPLCSIIYRVNKLFIAAVKHNNMFSV